MPPGLDGIETTARLLREDPEVGIVICSAYSDHSWEEMTAAFGRTDRVLILKKPFDTVEVRQLAHALAAALGARAARSDQGPRPDGADRRANGGAAGRERSAEAGGGAARGGAAAARRVERADPRARLPRRAHGPAESPPVQRAPREGPRPLAPQGHRVRGAVHRHRQLQAHQRYDRPSSRRRSVAPARRLVGLS